MFIVGLSPPFRTLSDPSCEGMMKLKPSSVAFRDMQISPCFLVGNEGIRALSLAFKGVYKYGHSLIPY